MKARLIVVGAMIFTVAVAVSALFATGILPPSDSSAAETTAPSTTTTPVAPVTEAPPLSRTLLSIDESGNVILAQTGSCDSGTPAVVTTVAPGAQPVAMPDPPAEVVRVIAYQGRFDVFGADDTCTDISYFNDAGTWIAGEPGQLPSNYWHLLPGGLGPVVESGAGPVYLDCPVIALSVVQVSQAFVGCDDGRIRATGNRGLAWSDPGKVLGLVDLAFTDPQNGYAFAVTPNCPSAVLQTADGGATWLQTGCIDQTQPGAAIATSGSLLAAIVGDQLWRSNDGGVSWSA